MLGKALCWLLLSCSLAKRERCLTDLTASLSRSAASTHAGTGTRGQQLSGLQDVEASFDNLSSTSVLPDLGQ